MRAGSPKSQHVPCSCTCACLVWPGSSSCSCCSCSCSASSSPCPPGPARTAWPRTPACLACCKPAPSPWLPVCSGSCAFRGGSGGHGFQQSGGRRHTSGAGGSLVDVDQLVIKGRWCPSSVMKTLCHVSLTVGTVEIWIQNSGEMVLDLVQACDLLEYALSLTISKLPENY